MLDQNDKRILSILQDDFPLEPFPYAVVARQLAMPASAVAARVRKLRADGTIRYIGAVLDTKKVGFSSSLIALAVPGKRIQEVSGIINGYSEVTHNYLRDDEYNMWFTVSAPTVQRRKALVRRICRDAGIDRYLDLATVRVFKINARFPLIPGEAGALRHGRRGAKRLLRTPGRLDRRILSVLGRPLDTSDRPFRAMARSIGATEQSVIDLVCRARAQGVIRRFGAILDHYKIGLRTNALVAWEMRSRDLPGAARTLSAIPYISHCYERKALPGWPYTLYTMIHARNRSHCRSIIQLILRSLRHTIGSYRVLRTVKELKKTRFDTRRLTHSR